jgi:hypothetical protein
VTIIVTTATPLHAEAIVAAEDRLPDGSWRPVFADGMQPGQVRTHAVWAGRRLVITEAPKTLPAASGPPPAAGADAA